MGRNDFKPGKAAKDKNALQHIPIHSKRKKKVGNDSYSIGIHSKRLQNVLKGSNRRLLAIDSRVNGDWRKLVRHSTCQAQVMLDRSKWREMALILGKWPQLIPTDSN